MQVAFLDENFELVRYFKYINLQWIRRYYEPGEFSAQIVLSQYDDRAAYVFTNERPELGIIQKREYADGYDGTVVQLSGFFYEYKLNDKITYPRFESSGNIESLARRIVANYKADIPILELGEANTPLLGTSITKQSTGDGLATVLYEMLKSQELAPRCRYDYAANKMYFQVWQGLDRTQDQDVNSFAAFSANLKNIKNENIVLDSSNRKNYGIVVGNGKYEDGKQIRVDVDLRSSPDEYQQILYIDKTGMSFDEAKQTRAEYEEQLRQAGMEDLAKYTDINSFSFDAVDKGLVYMRDFDLGDRCDMTLTWGGESTGTGEGTAGYSAGYVARITEIVEVHKETRSTFSLQFGEKVPTVYDKSRR